MSSPSTRARRRPRRCSSGRAPRCSAAARSPSAPAAWARTGWRPTRRSCSIRSLAAGRQALAAGGRARARGRAGQPGRDRAGLGPRHGQAAVPGDRLAGPPVGGRLRAARGPRGRTGRDHRPPAGPVLRRAEDDLAAGEPDRRGHRHHHRHLAAAPAGRGVRDRRRHRVPHHAARPGFGDVVRTRLRGVRPGPGGAAGGGGLRRDRGRDVLVRGRRSPSPGSPSTSRPRCWPRAAWPRATPSAPTARARSCWSPPGLRRCGPARGCPVRWPGGSAAR